MILVAVGFGLGRLQTTARDGGHLDIVSGLVQRTISPVAHVLTATANGTGDFLGGLGRAPYLKRRVTELQNELASHQHDAEQVVALQSQIDDLRKLQGFAALPGRKAIPGRVISLDRFSNRIMLDIGSKQGVSPNLAVVAPDGLLAVVQAVSQDRCQAQLIFSPNTKIGAEALRNPPTAGLLRGATPSQLIVEFLDPESPVEIDDQVVTSGFSEFIPDHLPIGTIYQIEDNADFGTRRAKVRPYVHLGTVRDVVVLK